MKNVIVYNDFAHPFGGAGVVALGSAVALAKRGYNVTFFSGTGPESPLLAKNNVKSICLNQPDILSESNKIKAAYRGIWNQKAYNRTLELLRDCDDNDTVILVHGFAKTLSSSIFAAFKRTNFKVMVFLHDYFTACPNGGFFNYQSHCNCNLKPISIECLLSNCDVRSYSQKLYRYVRQFMIRHNIKGNNMHLYAYNVSDLSGKLLEPYVKEYFSTYKTFFNPVGVHTGDYVDISKNTYYIYIGRLSEEKGIREFCHALTELKLNGIVLGDGYLMNEMKNSYPNIKFAGWVNGEEKVELILKSKCLVFPSKVHETFGLAVTEMLSYGIPCIVPDGCGCTPFVENGKNGFVYSMGDYEKLKECIAKFEALNINDIMEVTRSSFNREYFSQENYVVRLEEEINRLFSQQTIYNNIQ